MRNNEEGRVTLGSDNEGGLETMMAVMTKGGDSEEEHGSKFGICWCKEVY